MKNKKTNVNRRDFLKTGIGGLAGAAVLPARSPFFIEPQGEAKRYKLVYRTLGRTGIRLPVVSMGVMTADNPNVVRAALDAGVVMLDTANRYQRGRNEEMIGQVIQGRSRDSYVIATKVPGTAMDRITGLFTAETSVDNFLEQFEISLKRLGLEYVDILYLHNVWKKEAVLFEPLMKAMEKVKKEGKTRFIGVSTHQNEVEVLDAVSESKFHDVVLTAYNFKKDNHVELKQAIERAAKAGIGIVAMKTQAGIYWDKEKQLPINMKAALKWVLQDPNVHTAIPGFTTFDMMHEDLSVMEDLTLTDEEKAALVPPEKTAGLYCQQCGKCMPQCPAKLPIPDLMRGYMYARAYSNYLEAQELIQSLRLPENPCRDCGSCSVKCAKGFDVASRICEVVTLRHAHPGLFA